MAKDQVTDNRIVVRPAEAAQMLGCSRLLVYRMVRDGKLRSVKDGNRRLIRVADIEAYLQSLEKEVASA
jgi:excisionase family DNA binding protein